MPKADYFISSSLCLQKVVTLTYTVHHYVLEETFVKHIPSQTWMERYARNVFSIRLYLQNKNNPKYSYQEVLQWGEVMQKMINVKLNPFTNFKDLLDNATPDYTIVQKIGQQVDEFHQRIELKQAIYGKDVPLGDDDVMTSNSSSAVFARNFVKDMAEHVKFSEEEQRKLDDIQ